MPPPLSISAQRNIKLVSTLFWEAAMIGEERVALKMTKLLGCPCEISHPPIRARLLRGASLPARDTPGVHETSATAGLPRPRKHDHFPNQFLSGIKRFFSSVSAIKIASSFAGFVSLALSLTTW